MDEELSLRLQDEEWVKLAALDHSDAFHVKDSGDDLEEKEPAPEAESTALDEYEGQDYDGENDDYADVFKDEKGFNSLIRRQAKLNSHRGAFAGKVRIDLGRNGGGAHEGMFDEDTQRVLQKLVRKELLSAVRTRIYTGREADMYHSVGLDKATGQERGLALKIFKTNKGDFTKASERDPSGRKYGLDYVKKSIRRQLKIQAEREYKYLCRAGAALKHRPVTVTEEKLAHAGRGPRMPMPLILHDHILVTEFVGSDGHVAPSLADAKLNDTQLCSAYTDLLRAMRRLYQRARLVHANLSAANIRYYDGQFWITGIGHAVEVGAENHLELLTRDLGILDSFFRSSGVPAVAKRRVRLVCVNVAKEYVVTESPEQLLRRFPVLEPLLRD
ncbi:hypothetical protein PInf_002762 [Phytophthora infestans]|nr:hypothetical protein PInf_002762 [Phytophthora infestans]